MSKIAKQFLYGLFYLAILGGIGTLVYFTSFRSAPGCTNGRLDSGEEGVDCGGVCANVCVPADISAIQIPEPIWVFKPAENTVALLIKVQNPNLEFAAREFEYKIELFDASDNLLETIPGQSFIYAGEIKYLAVVEETARAGSVYRAFLTVGRASWEKQSVFPRPEIGEVENKSFADDGKTITASGRVTNKDASVLPRAEVIAVFMNKFGTPAGVSLTELDNLNPNESRQFSIIHPANAAIDTARTRFYVYYALRP